MDMTNFVTTIKNHVTPISSCPPKGTDFMSIGYFGRPGHNGGKTHFVEEGKPICKTNLPKTSEYQWCISHVNLDTQQLVECEKCNGVLSKRRKQI